MRVLVCEPDIAGHFLWYGSLAARAVRDVTSDVFLGVSREAVGSFWYGHFVRPIEREGRITVVSKFHGPRRRSTARTYSRLCDRLAHWALLERCILEVKPDHVIVPSGDRIINMLSLLPKVVSRGAEIEIALHCSIVGRKPAEEPLESRLRRLLIPRAPAVNRFHFVDPTQYCEARQSYPALARKFRSLPDPIDIFEPLTRTDARRALGLPLEGRIAAMVAPTPRKAPWPLFEMFSAGMAPKDCRLLLVGRTPEAVERHVRATLRDHIQRGQVLLLTNRTDEIDLHRAICASDLVIGSLSPLIGASSMCTRAVMAGRRFFAASSPWTEMMARDLGVADAFVDQGAVYFAARFRAALDRSSEPIHPDIVGRLRRFHAPDNFSRSISDRLRVRLGAKTSATVTWDWVLEAPRAPSLPSTSCVA